MTARYPAMAFPSCLFAFLSLLTPGLSAPSAAETQNASPPPAPELRLVVGEALPTLDPIAQRTQVSNWILKNNVFEGLVDFEAAQPVPALARAWRQKSDLVWVFELRDDVVFHDGRPMTAADVAAAIERARNHPSSRITEAVGAVDSVRVVDPTTFEVHLSQPSPRLVEGIALVPIVADAASEGLLERPFGTGPYRIDRYEAGKMIRLERFSKYWGALPRTPAATFLVEPDSARRLDLLLKGKADLVSEIPAERVSEIESRDDLWVSSALGGMVLLFFLDPSVPPLDDPRVREAIDLAIDREAIARDDLGHYARPAGQLGVPGAIGHVESLEAPGRDLDKARRLVAEAAAGQPLTLPLWYSQGAEKLIESLIEDLEEAGFRIERHFLPWDELYLKMEAGETPFVYCSLSSPPSDVGWAFEGIIHSNQPDGPLGTTAVLRYSNPEVDALIEASVEAADAERRDELLGKAAKIVAADRPVIPLLWSMNLFGIKRDLDWEPPPNGALELSKMCRCSL